MVILRAAAFAVAATAAWTSPAAAAPDSFEQACVARARSTPQRCACEAKLARASLDAAERAAMIRGLSGDASGLQAALARMSETKRKAFGDKMRSLQQRSAAQCG